MTRNDGKSFDQFNVPSQIDEIYFDFEQNTLFAFERVDEKSYNVSCQISCSLRVILSLIFFKI